VTSFLSIRVLGLVFAGSATGERAEMTTFLRETLGLEQVEDSGVEAALFELPDGSRFAVSDPLGMGQTSRSVGFLVASLDDAIGALREAGVEVGDPAVNDKYRYVHFRAPDGNLYELIEER
jgi:catechol 2,3-dioxygenase-like lactoylglutathione lyase family enzyme